MLEQSEAAWLEHPADLPHCGEIVRNVFEDMTDQDGVERSIWPVDCGDVDPVHGQGRVQIAADVRRAVHLLKLPTELLLRSDGQDARRCLEQARAAKQV